NFMDSQGDICMATSDCELTVESLQASQQQQQLSACDNSSAAAGLSPSKFSSSTPTKQQQQQQQADQQQHNGGYELLYSHGPGGAISDVSLRTPSGARYYNPFLRWEASAGLAGGGCSGWNGGITVSPGIFAPTAAVAAATAAAAAAAAAATLSPDHRARVCPDQIDSSEETALKQEAYSARLTAHWDSQFGVQDAIEAYFKSQIVAPSPAGFDNGKGGGRSRPEEPHVDSGTECAPKWNVSTQTILSIPAFFDLAAIISDNDDGGTNNCCGEPAADWAAESSPVRPSPPLQISQLPLTPDRVVKAFQVLPSSGSPQLGQQTRPKLQPNFQPMEVIKERSYCSMDTTSDSQPASVFCTSSLQQQQQQRMAASSYGEGSSFLTGSSGSMSDLVATPTAGGQLATAANASAAVDQPSGTASANFEDALLTPT
ncbi:hypothetical protein BOX15_Mlig007556g3, partial [Macrostomum lignano]